MSKIESAVEALALPVCEEFGLSLYDVEYKKEGSDRYLRIFIAKEDGVGIDDCENVSRKMSDLLDEQDPIPEAYILEVSSPGIERVLKKPQHFEGAIGEEVEVKLFSPMDGKKSVTGILKGYDGAIVTLEANGEEVKLEKEKCAQVKTIFHF